VNLPELQLEHIQTGDKAEVAQMHCCDGVAMLQRRRSDEQIYGWDNYSQRRLLAVDFSRQQRGILCVGNNLDVSEEVLNEKLAGAGV
jgi:hypothetical protein